MDKQTWPITQFRSGGSKGDRDLARLAPMHPDGLPIISRVEKFDNLIVVAGHTMLGMWLGPITGKLVSQLASKEKTDLDFTPFSAERF